MNGKIITNIIRTDPMENFPCRTSTLKVPHLTPEKNRSFLKDLFAGLKGPLYGYFQGDTVFFIGDDGLLFDLGSYLSNKYGITQPFGTIGHRLLDLEDQDHRKILQIIAARVFDNYLQDKEFLISSVSRSAIPTPQLQSKTDSALIHDEQIFESFYYHMRLTDDNRITLQFDPTITVLLPYRDAKIGDWVFPICFDTECRLFGSCQVLPRNPVCIVREADIKVEDCTSESNAVIAHNVRTNKTIAIPRDKVVIQASRGEAPYGRVRAYSLKDSETRMLCSRRLLDLLRTKDKGIVLELGERTMEFQRKFVKLKFNPNVTESEFLEYHIISEIQAVFGEGSSNVSPFNGLNRFGTYSYNKADRQRYPHPKIRLFSIFPSFYQQQVSTLLSRLKEGHYHYHGFSEESNPFRTSIDFENFPIDFENETEYINRVKAKIKNIQIDYSWKPGYLFLFAIPTASQTFYDQIKDFCLARKMRSQMIRCENLGFGWYPLYNFSLSIYAKAGGTPWVIDPSYFNLADCYVGMGFATKFSEEIGKGKFFVGVADVFNAYGEHISFALHQASVDREVKGLRVDKPFMKELMTKAIDRYYDKTHEVPNRIVIHKPVSFHKAEIEGIQEIMTDRKITKSFLIHVQHNSHFRAYDESLNYQIPRGTYFRIGRGNVVLFPTGYLPSQEKPHRMGTPKAVQLNVKTIENEAISRSASGKELFEICRNFLGFTRIRWNMLGTCLRDPLTIYASRKVAEWLKKDYKGLEGIDVRDIL
jgi:hypothetical protein